MKYLRYIIIGVFFGILMTKSEAISWFRIQEMFRFQSFHMYGIIGTSFIVGVLTLQFFKKKQVQSLDGEPLKTLPKRKNHNKVFTWWNNFWFRLGIDWGLSRPYVHFGRKWLCSCFGCL